MIGHKKKRMLARYLTNCWELNNNNNSKIGKMQNNIGDLEIFLEVLLNKEMKNHTI